MLLLGRPEDREAFLVRRVHGQAALDGDGFEVALIPETLERTTLGQLWPGDKVNLEVDVLAKYVERLVAR